MILIARAPHLKREHYAGSKRALNLRPLPPVHRGLAESKQTALGSLLHCTRTRPDSNAKTEEPNNWKFCPSASHRGFVYTELHFCSQLSVPSCGQQKQQQPAPMMGRDLKGERIYLVYYQYCENRRWRRGDAIRTIGWPWTTAIRHIPFKSYHCAELRRSSVVREYSRLAIRSTRMA